MLRWQRLVEREALTAMTTIPKTARRKYALRSGLPRRLSALALMTAHTSSHPTAARRSTTPPEKRTPARRLHSPW
jgi:hypothetical protein